MTEVREQIGTNRYGGILTVWKGAWGFIEPSSKINHPDAEMNNGRIFVHKKDLDPDLKIKKGCALSFTVYTDGKGLGAEEVKLSKKQPQASAAKGATKGVAQKGSVKSGKGTGKGAPQATQVRKVIQTIQKKGSGKGQLKKNGKMNGIQSAPVKSDTIDKSNRVRLSQGRIMGTILKLKGHIGWIKPDSAIPYSTKDSLFLHKSDFISQGLPLSMGCRVDFFVYQDESGVGAEKCRLIPGSKQPKVQQGKIQSPTPKRAVIKTFTKQQLQMKTLGGKAGGKGGKGGKGAKGTKGAKGAKVQKPRKRVTNERITGEVLEWKGKFGWVSAHESIDHPEAAKHDGKIYVSMKDIKGGKKELSVGETVEFFCYADGNGLGAEQIKAM
eukprot:gnl/MRDRNA2_/MRDRNA2_89241_c0_seq1.p1 gnl/MRDRNA2_/MRDRNA2_89241_c0~~gnl/MRDRNA2_/MRDRNA2_89241_c0_seq1.p1  ORF type:complete len:383 (+),score=99.10 gnl/MRDRNA2_/MRDRNA2_89241_c0_seq1:120-1268(+)